jgi:hypothetical protein
VQHILKKFIANGYQRVEFRAELVKLANYDVNGKLLGKLPETSFAACFDNAFK